MNFAEDLKERYTVDTALTPTGQANDSLRFRLPMFPVELTKGNDKLTSYPIVTISGNQKRAKFYGAGSSRFELNLLTQIGNRQELKQLRDFLAPYHLTAVLTKGNGTESITIQSESPIRLDHWLNKIPSIIQGFISTNDIFAFKLNEIR